MRRVLSPLIFLWTAALLLSPDLAYAQKPRAERPTYTLGEKWIRSDGVFELIRIEKDEYVFAADGRREIHLTKELGIALVLREGHVDWDFSPAFGFGWPLEVGRSGIARGILSAPAVYHTGFHAFSGRTGIGTRATWSVEAYEDVHVPAGTLKAFRVGIVLLISAAYNLRRDIRVWYAPELKQIVKMEALGFAEALNFQVVATDKPAMAPMEVLLEGLPDQARFSVERVPLAGRVTAGKGLTTVTVQLNGRDVSKHEDKQGNHRELALNVLLHLLEGRNILLVTLTDASGERRLEARTFYYDRPVAVTPAPPPGPAPPPLPAFGVALSSPVDKARVDQETIGLAALASGSKGVRRVVVSLNGTEVSRQAEQTPRPSVALNAPIKLRDGQNTIVVTATDAGGATQQAVGTVYYNRPVPLSVAIGYPGDGLQVSQENGVVTGLVTSSKGSVRISVTLNGAEVHQELERTPEKTLALSVPVTLRAGANTITVSAREPDGTTRLDVRTVVYRRPHVAAVPPAPPPPVPTRDRWAVVIGIGGYESGDIPKLRYAVADADAIYQVLTGPAGFKKEHVLLLTDKTERKPTFRNIRWALGTFLSRSARKDDTVVIFFAGHGAPESDPRGLERDGLAKYLIPSDADPEDLYATAFPMDELQTIFGRIEAERVVAFLDTCYSGAAGGRTFLAKRTRSSQVDDLFLERLTRSKGRAIITASRPAEVSMELPELGHGVFTYYLLAGLNGAADLNGDGIVTVQELYEYVEQQVTQKSRSVGGNQHPVMKGELEGVLPLVKVKGR